MACPVRGRACLGGAGLPEHSSTAFRQHPLLADSVNPRAPPTADLSVSFPPRPCTHTAGHWRSLECTGRTRFRRVVLRRPACPRSLRQPAGRRTLQLSADLGDDLGCACHHAVDQALNLPSRFVQDTIARTQIRLRGFAYGLKGGAPPTGTTVFDPESLLFQRQAVEQGKAQVAPRRGAWLVRTQSSVSRSEGLLPQRSRPRLQDPGRAS
jgi:hypothetical protein